jgi:hypothetical protein
LRKTSKQSNGYRILHIAQISARVSHITAMAEKVPKDVVAAPDPEEDDLDDLDGI